MSILSLSALSGAVLLLGACASHAPMARVAPETPPAAAEPRLAPDAAYIARVERVARRRGIEVQWVHPPTTVVGADQ